MLTFTATIGRQGEGYVFTHYIIVPQAVSNELLQCGHRRLLVSVGGKAYRRALVPSKVNGETILMGKDAMEFWGVKPGDTVNWSVEPDPEPDNLEIPDELTEWLEYDEEANAEWVKLPPGIQRSIAYYIRTAKSTTARLSRTEKMMLRVKTGDLETQKAAKRRALKKAEQESDE